MKNSLKKLNSWFIAQLVKFTFLCLTRKTFTMKDQISLGKASGLLNLELKNWLYLKKKELLNYVFLSSGDVINAYINQEAGKAIQSTDKQEILGNWILRGVFQLKEREVLTGQRLNELEINGIRLTKFKNGEIGIEFIWIDTENPPSDTIGWVAKK